MSTEQSREAPVADWITIPELADDPFPILERLRAEGGVHWVPAIGRHLVTSYAAVHDTELDQRVFTANEKGSLMIRAMGHSMLRKDDPEHHTERRAWQPVLRPRVVKRTWMPIFERTFEECFARLLDVGPGADLVRDLAAPYAAESLRRVLGLSNATQQDLQRWSQTMIDATGNYADDPEVWAKGERSFDEVDAALDEMLAWYASHEDDTLLSALVHAPNGQLSLESIRANIKMTIGGGLNEPRDALGVGAWALLTHPEQRTLLAEDPRLWDAAFDETIRWVAPIGMYSRQTTCETVLQGIRLPKGARLGISLLSANRDERVWPNAHRFDITRADEGPHLAFGKGVHVCLGAWVARAEVAHVAMPAIFDRLDGLALDPDRPPVASGWVFRGMTSLPVTWRPSRTARSVATPPSIAIVGSGPAGCYTAQALRRAMPHAELDVIDKLPVPFGLVRHGVAPDHQGTKAVSAQFARLFESGDVRFHGDVRVGETVPLERLRESFDAVVLAHGLHEDATLELPGGSLPGVLGAGRVTRLLTGHALEPRPAPSLGRAAAIVGVGNVAMDLVRLLAKPGEMLAGTDIDDEAHERLSDALQVLHVVGRSQPAQARFDPVMLREIAELGGIDHVVHGAEAGPDARSRLVAELAERNPTGAPLRIEWWFGHVPAAVIGDEAVDANELTGADGTVRLDVDSVITAIGFRADPEQRLVEVDERAAETGRLERGLYVAGWARRGPRGTIPTQRTDARTLADLVVADLRGPSTKPGRAGVARELENATSYDGWLLIDALEAERAAANRVRSRLLDLEEMRRVASAAAGLGRVARRESTHAEASSDRTPLTIAFATESGNAELVAEELAQHLEDAFDVHVIDLSEADVADVPATGLALVVSSTYGDGELPSGVRDLHAELVAQAPDLSGLTYAMLGLGDHSYATTYSRGSEILHETLAGLGATRVGPYGRHDAASGEPVSDAALAWVDALLAEVRWGEAAAEASR